MTRLPHSDAADALGAGPGVGTRAAGRRLGSMRHVVIVGGGIAGLAAAFFLRDEPVSVTVCEGSPRLGGKLSISEVAGIAVDEGAEALLARRPEGTGLIEAAGLADQLVLPGTLSSRIWTRGGMHMLPRRQFMGVPADPDEAACVLSADGVERAKHDRQVARDGDVSVASYVGGRLGEEVVDRLVDPLLGGVYAGRSRELSLEATLGPLAQAAKTHATLTEAAASLTPTVASGPATQATRTSTVKPVFTTLRSGLGTLPEALAKAAIKAGADIRTSAMVRELARTERGWRLTVGSAASPEFIDADAVIIATPGRPAGRLLAGVPGQQRAAAELAGIPYASMAIITLAFRQASLPENTSGYLVPAVDGRAVKAVTFSTSKWPHLAGGYAIVRCSVGRIGEEALLQRDDADLANLAAAELAEATGLTNPDQTRVTRWGGALPQYTVGHNERVARIRAAVADQSGLAVCGAAYEGVGVPACIATSRSAVNQVMRKLSVT